jgi:hypothetical protein
MIKAFKDALEAGHVEKALFPDGKPFVIDDVQYYQATDGGTNMAMGRFHSFGDQLRKHDTLKISDELLTTALSTMRDQLRTAQAQISLDPEQALDNLRYVLQTVERLQLRREYGLDIAQVYDIASIFWFSEQEDPAVVDSELNRKKINSWLKHPHLYAFFLATPLNRFVPLQQLADPATLRFTENLTLEELLDWKIIHLKSQQFGLTSDTIRTIELRMERLNALAGLNEALSNNTTPTSMRGSETKSEKSN